MQQLQTANAVCLQSGTGSGKTVIAGKIIQQYPDKVLFLVNRTALIGQTYETLIALGIKTAVIHSTYNNTVNGLRVNKNVDDAQVIITLVNTWGNVENKTDANLLIIDEAHKSTSQTYQELRDYYPNAKRIGLTATPGRAKNKDGEDLAGWYENNLINTVSIKELIRLGRLVQPQYVNLENNSHIVQSWLKLTKGYENRRTIVFGESIKHIQEIAQSFSEYGIKSSVILSATEDGDESQTLNQRNEIYKQFRNGEVEVLLSVNALCEGFDEEQTQFLLLCRNIGKDNVPLYHQMVGRVLRSHPSKTHGVVVDFKENLKRFGPIEEWDWDSFYDGKNQFVSLNPGDEVRSSTWANAKHVYVSCSYCFHVYDAKKHDECTHCQTPHNIRTYVYAGKSRQKFMNFINQHEKAKTFFLNVVRNNNSVKRQTVKKITKAALHTEIARAEWINMFFEKANYAQKHNKTEEFNKMIGFELFRNSEYRTGMLKALAQNPNAKQEEKIYYE